MTHPPDDAPALADDPGPLVRPFAVTRGRTGGDLPDLDIFTLVTTSDVGIDIATMDLDREYRDIVALCRARPQSIAEIAACCGLLVASAKVLVGDLITAGYVTFRAPLPEKSHDPAFLRAVLAGLRAL